MYIWWKVILLVEITEHVLYAAAKKHKGMRMTKRETDEKLESKTTKINIPPLMRTKMIENDGIFSSPDYIGESIALQDKSETLLDMFMNLYKTHKDDDFIGTIDYESQKVVYENRHDSFEKMFRIGDFLRKQGLKTTGSRIVGIFSVNRAEWIICEYGIYMANMTNCPLYSTFGAESILHILKETEMVICFLSGVKAVSLYEEVIKDAKHDLRMIVTFDPLEEDLITKYREKGIVVVSYNGIISKNDAENLKDPNSNKSTEGVSNPKSIIGTNTTYNEIEEGYDEEICVANQSLDKVQQLSKWDLPVGNSIATICYTSGTSGLPKGVILTHTNFIVQIAAFSFPKVHSKMLIIQEDDIYISYLPLAHVMERVCMMVCIACRAKVAFFGGNPKSLQTDIKIIKPTFFVGVPRVFNAFTERIQDAIGKKNCILRAIVKYAIRSKISKQKKGKYTHWFWDKLIFNKIKKEFGGKIRGCLNGSAPLAGHVVEFMQVIFSSRIFQGYGQTEGTAANILMTLDDFENERVGIPFPSNLVKLSPTEDYLGGMKGEICLKGNNISPGYYKREDLNKETFTDEWLKTGDIGVIEDGVFKIVGRRKEIFKMSQGEYIIPDKIENILREGIIEDIIVTGRSSEDYLIAIVVCKKENVTEKRILKHLKFLGEQALKKGLITRFEIPKKVLVIRQDFETYGEMLTPTMKKKRSKIESLFENEIRNLYETKD